MAVPVHGNKYGNTGLVCGKTSRPILMFILGFLTSSQLRFGAIPLHYTTGVVWGEEPLRKRKKKKNDKPYFVLHVGPPKTGSTTIQRSLDRVYADFLKLDGYIYEGKWIEGQQTKSLYGALLEGLASPGCMKSIQRSLSSSSRRTPKCWLGAQERIHQIQQQRRQQQQQQQQNSHTGNHTSIIISEETLGYHHIIASSGMYWKLLEELLADFHVLVVITYRRLFDWSLSSKALLEQFVFRKPLQRMWPDQGGWHHGPSTAAWVLNATKPWTYTDELVRYYSSSPWIPASWNWTVLNFHAPGQDLMTTLLCDVLPEAPRACQASREALPIKSNPTLGVGPYHTLAYAIRTKYGNTTASRDKVFNEIQRYIVGDNPDDKQLVELPMTACPDNQTMLSILEQSMELERLVLSKSEQNLEDLQQQFWSEFAAKVCDVDTEAVFRNTNLEAHLKQKGVIQS